MTSPQPDGHDAAGPRGWNTAPPPPPGGIPLRPLTAGEIVIAAALLAWRNPATCAGLTLAGNAAATAYLLTLTGRVPHTTTTGLLLFLSPVAVIALITVSALVAATGRSILGRKLGALAALRAGRPDRALLTALLAAGTVTAVWLVVRPFGHTAAVAATALAAVPVATTTAVTLCAQAVEDLAPLAALHRSWSLLRSNFWRVFGYLILLALLTATIFLLVGCLFAMWPPLQGVAAFLTAVLSTALTAGVLTLLHSDLRARHDAAAR